MPAYFVDSSALVKRYQNEAGSERVAEILDDADTLVISRLTQAEVAAAICRRGRATSTPIEALDTILAALNSHVENSFDVLELNRSVLQRAIEMTRQHALRAADAIQLASALLARGQYKADDIIVVSSDQELNAAATKKASLFSIQQSHKTSRGGDSAQQLPQAPQRCLAGSGRQGPGLRAAH